MSWFKYGILNGKIAAKKAETLTDDWTELQLTKQGSNYKHQGLSAGLYAVIVKAGSYSDASFVLNTGTSVSHYIGKQTYFEVDLTTTTIKFRVNDNTNYAIIGAKVKKII